MKKPRSDETAANVKSSQRDARSGSLQRMVRRRFIWEIVAYIGWWALWTGCALWHFALLDPLDFGGRVDAFLWIAGSLVAIAGFALWRCRHWPPMN